MTTDIEILQFLHYNPLSKRSDILPSLTKQISDRTLMRMLSDAVAKRYVEVAGRGPSTRYKLTPQAHVTMDLNLDTYFDKDIDGRQVQESFNFELINDTLPKVELISFRTVDSIDYKKGMLMFSPLSAYSSTSSYSPSKHISNHKRLY